MNNYITGHQLAQAYNELGSLQKVSEATNMSVQAIEMRIKRAGYELVKEYKLISREEFKRRWDAVQARDRAKK